MQVVLFISYAQFVLGRQHELRLSYPKAYACWPGPKGFDLGFAWVNFRGASAWVFCFCFCLKTKNTFLSLIEVQVQDIGLNMHTCVCVIMEYHVNIKVVAFNTEDYKIMK